MSLEIGASHLINLRNRSLVIRTYLTLGMGEPSALQLNTRHPLDTASTHSLTSLWAIIGRFSKLSTTTGCRGGCGPGSWGSRVGGVSSSMGPGFCGGSRVGKTGTRTGGCSGSVPVLPPCRHFAISDQTEK